MRTSWIITWLKPINIDYQLNHRNDNYNSSNNSYLLPMWQMCHRRCEGHNKTKRSQHRYVVQALRQQEMPRRIRPVQDPRIERNYLNLDMELITLLIIIGGCIFTGAWMHLKQIWHKRRVEQRYRDFKNKSHE